jgi:predicted nucleic acid-binding protein
MRVLVDTSIWSLALRRRRRDLDAAERRLELELVELIKEGRTVIIGAVRQEILSGVRDDGALERLRERLRSFPDEDLGVLDYEEAARCANRCMAAGLPVSSTDGLLCAVAMVRGLALFTRDADFERYEGVLDLRLHRPRTAGR